MSALPAKLLDHIRRTELLTPGERLGVAVSGGADSTALLRLLLELRGELGIVLSVVHFNHRLRGAESDQDEHFVAELAHRHELEFHLGSADTAGYAREKGLSVEEAARDLRYAFFAELATARADAAGSHAQPMQPAADPGHGTASRYTLAVLDKIATGHTLDDQAETVLMRVIRGTGLRGLGGIHPRVVVEGTARPMGGHRDQASEDAPDPDSPETAAEVIRPLLAVGHRELEAYLREMGQEWREDSSNRDPRFTRNRVRAQLLPLLEREFNPAVAENLAELANIARAEEDYWENEVAGWMGTGIHWSEPAWARPASGAAGDLVQLQPANPELQRRLAEAGPLVMDASVDRVWLLSEPRAVQRRIVKAIGDLAGFPLEFRHVEEVLHFAERHDAAGKQLGLPLGWKVEQSQEALIFRTPDLQQEERIPVDYAYCLPIPGRTAIPEAGIVVEALPVALAGEAAGYNRDQLFDVTQLPKELIARNWRAGDRIWPAHTKAPKKVKELLQESGVTGEARKRWPVLESDGQVFWLRGFPVPAALQPATGARSAIWVREVEDE